MSIAWKKVEAQESDMKGQKKKNEPEQGKQTGFCTPTTPPPCTQLLSMWAKQISLNETRRPPPPPPHPRECLQVEADFGKEGFVALGKACQEGLGLKYRLLESKGMLRPRAEWWYSCTVEK